MQYEIEVGGRRRQVTVVRKGSVFTVTVDGRAHDIDAVRINAQTLSLILDGAASKETVVATDPAGQMIVGVDGVPIAVSANGKRRGHRDDGAGSGSGPQRLVAPMPGKIVRVLVASGDAVEPRQPLVVIEAMKMENELRAARAGTVVEVHAREGRSVDAGALLAVIQ